jgi:cytochrome c2
VITNVGRCLLGAVAALLASVALAQSPAGHSGPEEPEYVWNSLQGEKLHALRAKGDATRGEITFEFCLGCHRSRALGRSDG